MRKVPLEMLTPDMILGRTISYGNSILIRAGMKELNRFAKKLEELGIRFLYIEDILSKDIDIEDVVSDRTRIKCKKSLNIILKKVKSDFTMDSTLVTELVENLMDEILNHPKTLFSLSAIDHTDESTLNHSINATIYAVCMGIELGLEQNMLVELAEGTILHDLGKTVLDKKILMKPGSLNAEEFEHIKQHTVLGYELLKKIPGLSERSRQISLYHHERMDGSGYPRGIVGAEIPLFVRIVSIVDIYEALTSERCYHKAISPYRAMEILTEEAATKLDPDLAAIFLQKIAVYPNGALVHLSDGSVGVVKAQNPSMPLRPVVRVFETKQGRPVAKLEVDLMKVLNLTIEEEPFVEAEVHRREREEVKKKI